MELINIFVFVLVGVLFLAAIRPRSWRRASESARLVFRPPWVFRVFLMVFAFHLTLDLCWMIWNTVPRLAVSPSLDFGTVVVICGCLFLVYGLVLILRILWLIDYHELEVDLDRRTYHLTRRWLLVSRTKDGYLEELAEVSVEPLVNMSCHRVLLRPSQPLPLLPRLGYTLGAYRDPGEAEAEAIAVGSRMGLAVTERS